jgi:hypothetical protein
VKLVPILYGCVTVSDRTKRIFCEIRTNFVRPPTFFLLPHYCRISLIFFELVSYFIGCWSCLSLSWLVLCFTRFENNASAYHFYFQKWYENGTRRRCFQGRVCCLVLCFTRFENNGSGTIFTSQSGVKTVRGGVVFIPRPSFWHSWWKSPPPPQNTPAVVGNLK